MEIDLRETGIGLDSHGIPGHESVAVVLGNGRRVEIGWNDLGRVTGHSQPLGAPVSYFDIVRMEMELSNAIGRKVDLRTAEELSRYFRDQVVASALPQYERN